MCDFSVPTGKATILFDVTAITEPDVAYVVMDRSCEKITETILQNIH